MPRVYIAVGSNIDPESNVPTALRMLSEAANIVAVSTFYRTAALGPDAPDFINGVVAIDAQLPASELKSDVLRPIEAALGRVRTQDKYAPRQIDLDIAVYGDRIIDSDVSTRAFLAAPLIELDPDLPLPEAARKLDTSGMAALTEFTDNLRRELLDEPGQS